MPLHRYVPTATPDEIVGDGQPAAPTPDLILVFTSARSA